MCMDCGCGKAHDPMGDAETHITYERIKRAADADHKTVDEVLHTMMETAEKDRMEHPSEWRAA